MVILSNEWIQMSEWLNECIYKWLYFTRVTFDSNKLISCLQINYKLTKNSVNHKGIKHYL